MRKTEYYQPGMPDPVLEDGFVIEVVRQYVKDAKKVVSIDDSHGEARTYNVDDRVILKVQRPHRLRSSTSLHKEAFFLQHLAGHTDVSVPRVYGYEKRSTLEYICMSKMRGVAADHVKLSVCEKNCLLLVLGKELRKIHDADQTPLLNSGLFPADEPRDLAERIRQRYLNVFDTARSKSTPELREAWMNDMDDALNTIHDPDSFRALHANPYTPHVFIDEKTKTYNGIIDFGDAYIGHPVFDMWYWKVASRETLLKGYSSEKPVSASFLTVFNTLNRISRKSDDLKLGLSS